MKQLRFVAVVGSKEQTIKSGDRKGQTRVILTVQTSDGKVSFLNEDYISRKLELVGATLSEFKQNPGNFVLNLSTDTDGNLGEIHLRKEGEPFEYVDADGKEQVAEPRTTYYDIRGSYTFTYSETGDMSKSIANILAEKMAKQLGISLSDNSTPAPQKQEEVVEQEFVIDEDETVA